MQARERKIKQTNLTKSRFNRDLHMVIFMFCRIFPTWPKVPPFRPSTVSLTLALSRGERGSLFYRHFPRAYALGYAHAAPLALGSQIILVGYAAP